jgi:protein-disulfide isomerase
MSDEMLLRVPITDSDHSSGSKTALITLVEYGDYQCPHCGRAYPIVGRLQKALMGDLRFVFRNFPLAESHPDAMLAARAAEAAALQGKFWEMHDSLYENQDSLDAGSMAIYASVLDLDEKAFIRDLESERVDERVAADIRGGIASGVNGTPTFFVNGFRYQGDWSFEPFLQALIEAGNLAPF